LHSDGISQNVSTLKSNKQGLRLPTYPDLGVTNCMELSLSWGDNGQFYVQKIKIVTDYTKNHESCIFVKTYIFGYFVPVFYSLRLQYIL
jgi:hypothetical protein